MDCELDFCLYGSLRNDVMLFLIADNSDDFVEICLVLVISELFFNNCFDQLYQLTNALSIDIRVLLCIQVPCLLYNVVQSTTALTVPYAVIIHIRDDPDGLRGHKSFYFGVHYAFVEILTKERF
jgi:hypothetical protein